jgi:hypothetical protein
MIPFLLAQQLGYQGIITTDTGIPVHNAHVIYFSAVGDTIAETVSDDGLYSLDVSVLSTSKAAQPETFILHHNFPDPFNPSTLLPLDIPSSGIGHIEIFDLRGRRLAEREQDFERGNYVLRLGFNQPNGIYFARFTFDGISQVEKLINLGGGSGGVTISVAGGSPSKLLRKPADTTDSLIVYTDYGNGIYTERYSESVIPPVELIDKDMVVSRIYRAPSLLLTSIPTDGTIFEELSIGLEYGSLEIDSDSTSLEIIQVEGDTLEQLFLVEDGFEFVSSHGGNYKFIILTTDFPSGLSSEDSMSINITSLFHTIHFTKMFYSLGDPYPGLDGNILDHHFTSDQFGNMEMELPITIEETDSVLITDPNIMNGQIFYDMKFPMVLGSVQEKQGVLDPLDSAYYADSTYWVDGLHRWVTLGGLLDDASNMPGFFPRWGSLEAGLYNEIPHYIPEYLSGEGRPELEPYGIQYRSMISDLVLARMTTFDSLAGNSNSIPYTILELTSDNYEIAQERGVEWIYGNQGNYMLAHFELDIWTDQLYVKNAEIYLTSSMYGSLEGDLPEDGINTITHEMQHLSGLLGHAACGGDAPCENLGVGSPTSLKPQEFTDYWIYNSINNNAWEYVGYNSYSYPWGTAVNSGSSDILITENPTLSNSHIKRFTVKLSFPD